MKYDGKSPTGQGGAMARTGRRPGPTRTPEQIRAAARTLFAERGYPGTSVRAVAAAAGVNPALVHHYFGTKEQLFVTALQLPFDPTRALAELSVGPRQEIGARFVRFVVRTWRDPDTGPQFRALLRHAVGTDEGARSIRALAENVLLPRAAGVLGVPPLRFAAAMSHLIGLAIGSSILEVGPLAEADEDALVELVGPVISHYLAPG
jgi:AcrR family transcriptional regulator